MAKECELCRKNPEAHMRFGVGICQSCIEHYHKAILGDLYELKYFITPENFPNPTDKAH